MKNPVVGGEDEDGDTVIAVAEFETTKYAKSNRCLFCFFFPWGPISNLCCLPYWCTMKYQSVLQCWLTPRALKIRSGFINIEHKTIPLDKIQDLNVYSGCIDRSYGTLVLKVQTAGAGSEQTGGAEGVLPGIKNVHEFRKFVLEARNEYMAGTGRTAPMSSNNAEQHAAGSSSALGSDRACSALEDIRSDIKRLVSLTEGRGSA